MGVLGTLVLDTIRRPGEREPVEGPGGVTYALAAFEACPPPGWGTMPLVKVGSDARSVADGLLDRLETVASREGVRTVEAPNNRVELVYDGRGGRTERLSGGVPGWELEELAPLLASCRALYVNLVAGWEVDLGCARRLRRSVRGPLYCDLHSLLLDRGEGGVRRRRAPEGWRDWIRCFDYVQVNRDELATLAEDAGEEPRRLAGRLAGEGGPRALFVTLGPEGAGWVSAGSAGGLPGARGGRGAGAGSGAGGRTCGRSAPPRRVEGGDPTGCGDVWGMGCFAALLEGVDLATAVERANRLASRNAARSGGLGLLGSGRAASGTEIAEGGRGPSGEGAEERADGGAGREERR